MANNSVTNEVMIKAKVVLESAKCVLPTYQRSYIILNDKRALLF